MAIPIKANQLLYHSHVGTFLFKFISCHIMYLIARPEMAEDALDACSSYCTHMASGHLSLQQQQHSGHFGSWEVALALVLVALTRPCLQAAHSSAAAAAAARGRRAHTGCIALETAPTPCIANIHASAPRASMQALWQCNAMRDAVGVVGALQGEQPTRRQGGLACCATAAPGPPPRTSGPPP